jgi:transcriptional regulator with XRE-family HTH domain
MARQSAKIKSSDGDIEQEIREAIGTRIAELRRKRKLSARLVGEKLGISREAVTHIETGRNNITALALWKLATLFRCDFKDFFPDVPDGYGLTKIDTDKIAQEGGQKAASWARELFGTKLSK